MITYKVTEIVDGVPVQEKPAPVQTKQRFASIFIDGHCQAEGIPIPEGQTDDEVCKVYMSSYIQDRKTIAAKDVTDMKLAVSDVADEKPIAEEPIIEGKI